MISQDTRLELEFINNNNGGKEKPFLTEHVQYVYTCICLLE